MINAAGGTAGSDRVLQILDEVAGYRPDLVLVVMGNNEISSRTESIRIGFFQRLAVLHGLRRSAPRLFRSAPRFEMGQPELYEHFRANLRAMRECARSRGFNLVFGTLPINLPRRSLGLLFQGDAVRQMLQSLGTQDALALDDQQRQALQSYLSGDFGHASALIASRMDGRSVYLRAAADERLGKIESARRGYVRAQPELSHLLALNRILGQEAEQDRTPLLDLDAAVQRMSTNGLAGRDVFLDDCHLRWFAYAGLSSVIVQELAARGLVADNAQAEPLQGEATRFENLCPLQRYLPQAAKQAAGYVVLSGERPLIDALPLSLLR